VSFSESSSTLSLPLQPSFFYRTVLRLFFLFLYTFKLYINYSDIVSFSEISSKLDARDVQRTLDALFRDFDLLCDHHGLMRLEILGDCFVVVGNLVRFLLEE
jgi:hypothetical protein